MGIFMMVYLIYAYVLLNVYMCACMQIGRGGMLGGGICMYLLGQVGVC